jgi:hypothetical protein
VGPGCGCIRPALVFVQEVPSAQWLGVWEQCRYDIILGIDRGWKTRSALLVRDDLDVEPITSTSGLLWDDIEFRTLVYHGSYVAAGMWRSEAGPVLLASVHASPQRADPGAYGWTGQEVTSRHGGGDLRYAPNELWDSDLLLWTLRELNSWTKRQAWGPPHGALIAAGDLNEARDFDLGADGQRLGTWGDEYFARLRAAGLGSWLHDRWGEERPTHGRLQLDHVLASPGAMGWLDSERAPHLDRAWDSDTPGLGDHTPVWFALNEQRL